MDWMKIASAVALGLMIALLIPQAKTMLTHSPKAQRGDWAAVAIPLLGVLGVVLLLMSLI
jgi:hypothetical protein